MSMPRWLGVFLPSWESASRSSAMPSISKLSNATASTGGRSARSVPLDIAGANGMHPMPGFALACDCRKPHLLGQHQHQAPRGKSTSIVSRRWLASKLTACQSRET